MSNSNWYLAAIGKRQISYQSMTDKHIHAFISSHVTHCTSGWHLNIHMCVLFTIVFLLLLIQAWWSCDIACCYMYCINMPCEHFFRRNTLIWAFLKIILSWTMHGIWYFNHCSKMSCQKGYTSNFSMA